MSASATPAADQLAGDLAVAGLLAPHWSGIDRQEATRALVGGLLRSGLDAERALTVVKVLCLVTGDADIEERSFAARRTAERLADDKPVTGWPALAELLGSGGDVVVRSVRGQLKAATARANGTHPEPRLVARLASAIRTEAVDWLWPARIPLGMVTLLDGDPGLGKSLITVALGAAVSRGSPVAAGAPALPAAGVLILAAEDDPARTIVPRLRTAGADLDRVHVLDGLEAGGTVRPVVFPDDLPRVADLVAAHGVKLVVIDPILGFLGAAIDSHKDQSIREVLHAVKQLAEATGAAVVMIRHLNKKAGDAAMYRGGGSIAFTAAARSALVVGRVPDRPGVCALASVKCNLAETPKAVTYSITAADGVPVVTWGGEAEVTADDLLPAPDAHRGHKRDAAGAWLAGQLANGPVPAKDLFTRAAAAGIAEKTLRRAKGELGVAVGREGKGPWLWSLPPEDDAEDGHEAGEREVATFQDGHEAGSGHLRGNQEVSPKVATTRPKVATSANGTGGAPTGHLRGNQGNSAKVAISNGVATFEGGHLPSPQDGGHLRNGDPVVVEL